MSEEQKEPKTRFYVQYKPTGTNWPGERPIRPGRQGEFEFLSPDDEPGIPEDDDAKVKVCLNAEDGVKACRKFFNERVTEAAIYNDAELLIKPEKRIFGEHVIVWIEKRVDGVLVEMTERELERCALLSALKESPDVPESESTSTSLTEKSSRRKSGTRQTEQVGAEE